MFDSGLHELSVLSGAEGESLEGDSPPVRTDQQDGGPIRSRPHSQAVAPGTTVLLRNQFVVAATVHMVES